jgi:hypothetical protein
VDDPRQPLHDAHDEIDDATHVVRRETTDKVIELIRGRADAEKEWYLNEEDYEGCRAVKIVNMLTDQKVWLALLDHTCIERQR